MIASIHHYMAFINDFRYPWGLLEWDALQLRGTVIYFNKTEWKLRMDRFEATSPRSYSPKVANSRQHPQHTPSRSVPAPMGYI